ncbi:MAG TPA: glycosyltransferase family 4 protein [Rhizomicrobium sp.]|nr:glycosyltransferase family 4 protein [Rhizomicrobium sp.]
MNQSFTIGFPYAADRFGGSTSSSLILARALQDAGHRIQVLVHGGEGRVAVEAKALGLAVTHLPALTILPGYARPDRFRIEQIRALPASCAAIARLGLDIVHTNDIAMLRGWSMPCLARGAALVAHWRSNYCDSWSVKTSLRIARAVIAVSQYSFEKLPSWVQAKGVVEYNSFDLELSECESAAARREIRTELGVPANAALIGVFGNHIKRKRTHVLADLLAAITHTSDGRPVYGLACGARAEPYDAQLDEKIESFGLHSRLLRPGFVRPVERWMASCDVLIAPAVEEPLARNVLEAQALGVPVVVSTDGGLKELIHHGENGLLCDPYDGAGWERATRLLLDDRVVATRLAQNGRATVAALAPAQHAQRIAAVYRSLFDRTHRSTRKAA